MCYLSIFTFFMLIFYEESSCGWMIQLEEQFQAQKQLQQQQFEKQVRLTEEVRREKWEAKDDATSKEQAATLVTLLSLVEEATSIDNSAVVSFLLDFNAPNFWIWQVGSPDPVGFHFFFFFFLHDIALIVGINLHLVLYGAAKTRPELRFFSIAQLEGRGNSLHPGDKKEDASLKEGRYVAVEDAGTLYRYSILFGNELTRSLLEITQTVPMIVVGILHLILMDIALAFRKGNPIDLARDTRICRDRKQPFFPTGQGRRLEILPVLDISLPI
ncbi:hypothetical protein ACJX0J_037352 [Zea mays]